MQDSFQIEFTTALLEEVFKTLSKQVHDHDVVHFSIFSLLVSNEMKEWHEGLASKLVDQLALPEKHDVSLHLDSFLLYSWNHKEAFKSNSEHAESERRIREKKEGSRSSEVD